MATMPIYGDIIKTILLHLDQMFYDFETRHEPSETQGL